ncbi:unnamed protein product [Prorocentrum cordatum]|uniref:Protein-tyrosine-phosphatase n=1 Tax=Prorocentrum cordatum TaxID=2364126 RepID=A0ABN9WEB5_9DINO|nr:unnamed protein product [Polarella glacialis]|mmetsp:Transcript_12286/g.33325  ORF Transcript_12286/g.33325 Transcript_12286/m.33325 type:complete len:446 (-) Transcript_12286:225-1562(-)
MGSASPSAGAPRRGGMGILHCTDEPERRGGWPSPEGRASPGMGHPSSTENSDHQAHGPPGGPGPPPAGGGLGTAPAQLMQGPPGAPQMALQRDAAVPTGPAVGTVSMQGGGYFGVPPQAMMPGGGSMYAPQPHAGLGSPAAFAAGGGANAAGGAQGRPAFQAGITSAAAQPIPQPQQQQQQPQDIVIIWDWDDTLMCSSAINANAPIQHQAPLLEGLLERVLSVSMQLGETFIVTNADELWVHESTRRFVPGIMPILSRMGVVSARRRWEARCPGDVFAWKRETFREMLAARAPRASGLNLIVLGDSPAEMEAAQTSVIGLPQQVTIKTVKFKEAPSVEELIEQLRICLQELGTIVSDDKSCSRNLVNWMVPRLQAPQYPMSSYAPSQSFPTAPSMSYSPSMMSGGWQQATPYFAGHEAAPGAPTAPPAGPYLGPAAAVYAGGMR